MKVLRAMIFLGLLLIPIYSAFSELLDEDELQKYLADVLTRLNQEKISKEEALDELKELFEDEILPQLDEEVEFASLEPKIEEVFTMVTTALEGGGDFDSALASAVENLSSILTNPASAISPPGVELPDASYPMIWIYDNQNNAIANISLNNGLLTVYTFQNGEVSSYQVSASDKADFFKAMEKSPFWKQVFGNMSEDEKKDVLDQLYQALVTGELGVGDKIQIDGITFELVKEGKGSRLDAYKNGKHYKMRHLDPSLTQDLENSKGKSLEEAMNDKKNWSKKMKGDPAATGKVFYDEKEGLWKMEVEYWSNLEVSNQKEKMTITLNLDYFLDPHEKEAIIKKLQEAARNGEEVTLYGATLDDLLKEGYVLDVLGWGKGDFSNHQLPEETLDERTAEELKTKEKVSTASTPGYSQNAAGFYLIFQR